MNQPVLEVLHSLPGEISERVRVLRRRPFPKTGEFVLYWMRTAMRGTENPALTIAIETANCLGLPLLVYQGVSERYPFASDRHHTFLLQGARDVQQELSQRNINYVVHVERPGHRSPAIRSLAERAAIVVTEDMPVQPLRRWTELLCRGLDCSVWTVDTACVVPMQIVGRSFDRAFEYREATKLLYHDRVTAPPLPEIKLLNQSAVSIDLPFDPVDLQQASVSHLVAECEIDHSIGPVPHTAGGSVAGGQRWDAFRRSGLAKYDRLRNNPLVDGASQMSAYLHYGMVSPQRLAREASADGSSGAKKYLDELLIWRELAYTFCFYRPEHGRLSALPSWAAETLAKHESDSRTELLSWETMARGRSGDSLWDSAQSSLLIHGQVHNNMRMTWGKAIVNWTPNAKQALKRMIDLNHRYALDGRDPASYGGILWCLGQFDRPFEPPQPIFGTVRRRTTADQVRRLDPARYRRVATRPLFHKSPSVAIIGGGLSGLICGRTLVDHGIKVRVFEKSRGLGGRMATRRVDNRLRFDHGAQYFTVRDARFRRYVRSWQQDHVVRRWDGRIVLLENGAIKEQKGQTERYVCVPTMNAIGKHLAADLDITLQTRAIPPRRDGNQWRLASEDGIDLGLYDFVVVSAPAGQAADLLAAAPELAQQARSAVMTGCWTVMLAMADPRDFPFDAAFVHDSPLSWIARNDSKPGRDTSRQAWTLHASPDWSERHLEMPADQVRDKLVAEFWNAVGDTPATHTHAQSHLWRFALPSQPLAVKCLFDSDQQIGACGDWCGGPRVEGAFLSGMALAGRVNAWAQSFASAAALEPDTQLELF